METWDFVGWQFGMTIVVAMAIGVFLLYRARRSQRRRGETPGAEKLGEHQR